MNTYEQTELEIEIAKKNLEDICRRYDVPCDIKLGADTDTLCTIIVNERMCADTEDRWPEVVACNIPAEDVNKYLMSQHIFNNYYILEQTERIGND